MFFNKNTIAKNIILVISPNSDRLNMIAEHLHIKGQALKTLQKPFSSLTPKDLDYELEALILDLGLISQYQEVIEHISKILPKSVHCIIFGDNDSISMKQNFAHHGFCYLHFATQMPLLFAELENKPNQKSPSPSIKISIFGSKGGIGNSFLAYHLAKTIFSRYKTKILLIQGLGSSFNLDLFANVHFVSHHYQEHDLSLYKESHEDGFGFEKFAHLNFNFIIYDYPAYSQEKEKLEQIFNVSDCTILLFNREFASIRKAKEMLQVNDFLLSVDQGCKKTLLVLNDISLYRGLHIDEIKTLLGAKIDLIIPQNKKIKEIQTPNMGITAKSIDLLTSLVVGNHKKPRLRFFEMIR